jgi:hypothetical protein
MVSLTSIRSRRIGLVELTTGLNTI